MTRTWHWIVDHAVQAVAVAAVVTSLASTVALQRLEHTLYANCRTSHVRWEGRVSNLRGDLAFLQQTVTFINHQVGQVSASNVSNRVQIVGNYEAWRATTISNIMKKQRAIDTDPEPQCGAYHFWSSPTGR